MNEAIEVLVIATIAYKIVGYIMNSANYNFGIWFGRKGGRLLWLLVVLMISGSYH